MTHERQFRARSFTKTSLLGTALLMLLLSPMLSGCSKRTVYNSIIEHERSNAKLVAKTEILSYGKVSYLTNTTTGNRTPIVMLHGFGGEKDNWDRFSKKLTDDYRLIIPDLPGHGDSLQDMSLNYGVEEQAKRLKQLLDALGVRKAHLVGNSMGGAIALRFTSLYPQSVLSLSLMDSAGAVKTPSDFDALVKATGKNPFMDVRTSQDYESMMKYLFVKPPYLPGFIVDVLVEEKVKRKALEQKMFRDIMADMDQTAMLSSVHVPTLVIWGAQDRVTHVDDAEFLRQKISGSRKEVLEGVGHCPMIEKPDVTSELYRQFLQQSRSL
ncbi:alpha/beta fold hydrolase [Geomonas oryzae]|uniref:alpha/beta fold hydrolase n=1 Tax=Geomonas oryzae TaxID=2364273 RepID=UPI00100B3750|nr:alpha/beta fold hydrolase [Geomonas oryzae]